MIVDLVPVLALVLALAWAAWAARPKRAAGMQESVEAHHRLLAALAPGSERRAGRRRRR